MAILVKCNVIFHLLIFVGIEAFLTLDSDTKSLENIYFIFESLFPQQPKSYFFLEIVRTELPRKLENTIDAAIQRCSTKLLI